MRYVKSLIVVFTVALPILAAQIARADGLDESMTFTFGGPVEIPGKLLPAGTYQFELADPNTTRNVVQIRSEDGAHVYATLLTIPRQPESRMRLFYWIISPSTLDGARSHRTCCSS